MSSKKKNTKNGQRIPVSSDAGSTSNGSKKSSNDGDSEAVSSLSSSSIPATAAAGAPSKHEFTSVPSGFRLGGSAKELHGQPIYCVSWSTDLYEEAVEGDAGGTGEAAESAESAAAGVASSQVDANKESPLDESKEIPEQPPQPLEPKSGSGDRLRQSQRRLLSCLATCGGNHVTVYEVEASSARIARESLGTNTTFQSNPSDGPSSGGLVLRQAYRDADDDEIFYACAFGGRSIGSGFGFGPVGNDDDVASIEQEKGETTIIGEPPSSKEGERKGSNLSPSKKRRKITTTTMEKETSNLPKGDATMTQSKEKSPSSEEQQKLASKKSGPSTASSSHQKPSVYSKLVNLSSYDGPQLLCAAGARGIIKVIDTVRRTLLLTLSGHGDEIYDMKFSPIDEWLLITASKDESLRLWNVETATCVAIFAGHEGHRDSVLSLAWHPLGQTFASAGMDTTVKLWSLEEQTVKDAIEASEDVEPREWSGLPGAASMEGGKVKKKSKKPFQTIYEQMPIFSTNKVHTDYVDCVQFVGDLILSKSITDTIVLWKPDLTSPRNHHNTNTTKNGSNNGSANNENNSQYQRLRNKVIALREFTLKHCDIWFIRFSTDVDCRMLAIGNNRGIIKVWKVDTESSSIALLSSQGCTKKTKKAVGGYFASLFNQHCASTVRMVSFSPDAKSLVAACDDSTVWKWDALD